MSVALSILDLAPVNPGEQVADSLAASVELARHAEDWGYRRIWYAEHHNLPIASSATSVLIAHIAAQTSTIRLGSGGIMLPNHAPLIIAEQFGTLEALHPGRIDLGLGRAPGTDQQTARALRRDPASAERFPQDVVELQAHLADENPIPGIRAIPGQGTRVPLYILGSSLFGAQLAAQLGLPYGFASHFAPGALRDAVSVYRERFTPSQQSAEPWVIAGVNVICADTSEEAQERFLIAQRRRVSLLFGQGRTFSDEEADQVLATPAGQQVRQMLQYSAVGTPQEVSAYLAEFAEHAQADELILASAATDRTAWLRSLELVAEVEGLSPVR